MASLSSLYERLDRKRRELKKYQERLEKVTKIRGDLVSDFDNNVEDAINKSINSCEYLERSIKGELQTIELSVAELDSLREKYVLSDYSMSAAIDNLDQEVTRCEREISRLESEIRSIKRQIEAERNKD